MLPPSNMEHGLNIPPFSPAPPETMPGLLPPGDPTAMFGNLLGGNGSINGSTVSPTGTSAFGIGSTNGSTGASPEVFPQAQPLKLNDDEKKKLCSTIYRLYTQEIQRRKSWSAQHQIYDAMYRGSVNTTRTGPWIGSSNLHVQMPYWLVDSINTRMVTGIWSQTPLVSGGAEEDDDQEALRNAIGLVSWHLQPKRMNARSWWSLISRIRCIHGFGAGLISYVKDAYVYRVQQEQTGSFELFNPDGSIKTDDQGRPLPIPKSTKEVFKRGVRYDGPILTPIEWDDLLVPEEGNNLQPKSEANPLGADWVGIRQWEPLSLIWKKRDSAYLYLDKDKEAADKDWWLSRSPAQDRSSSEPGNNQRSKLHDRFEGRRRNPVAQKQSDQRPNPEFETLRWMMPWEIDNEQGEKEEIECVFFMSIRPQKLLGAFRLSDVYWKGDRPLLEMHYQRVGTRFYSMGVMEICKHLSAELDTIHNMRMDVGFATNLPFFFYRASSAFDPSKIELKPLKGVPVDDINDVRFPTFQNVTTFYNLEEQQLYTLVERVMGVTDLFLGLSPTRGAAARHATGFVGTQQEALARTSEVLSQDAQEFGFLCRTLYNMELQYGPEARIMRLQGKEGPLTQKLTRDQLWMRGEYDFSLGANEGMFSSYIRQQQGQALLQTAQLNPFLSQDPARMWEMWNFYYYSIGIQNPTLFIGPKEALGQGSAKNQDEENLQMVQFQFGDGIPAPVHPNDNDAEHVQKLNSFIASENFAALGRPNMQAFINHTLQHAQAMQRKQQQLQQQQMMAMQGQGGNGSQGPPGPPGGGAGPALGQERIEPQLKGMGNMGGMGDINQASGGGGANASPRFPKQPMTGGGR